MSHWDNDIDRTLSALKRTAPPADLDARILRRLQAAPAAAHPVRLFPWFLALPALAALVLAIRLAHHRPHATAAAPPVLTKVLPAPVLAPVAPAPPSPARTLRRPHTTALAAPAAPTLLTSFPAPEVPLTHQERLLLRLARRPTAGTLAIFDHALREQRAQLAAADFKDFFKPPPAIEQPIVLKEEPNEPAPHQP